MCVDTCVYMQYDIYATGYMCIYTHTHTYNYMQEDIYTHKCTRVDKHTCLYLHIYVPTNVKYNIYIKTCISRNWLTLGVGLVSLKSAGQGAGLETQAPADPAIWTQNSFFSGKPQRLLLRP